MPLLLIFVIVIFMVIPEETAETSNICADHSGMEYTLDEPQEVGTRCAIKNKIGYTYATGVTVK